MVVRERTNGVEQIMARVTIMTSNTNLSGHVLMCASKPKAIFMVPILGPDCSWYSFVGFTLQELMEKSYCRLVKGLRVRKLSGLKRQQISWPFARTRVRWQEMSTGKVSTTAPMGRELGRRRSRDEGHDEYQASGRRWSKVVAMVSKNSTVPKRILAALRSYRCGASP